MKKSIILLLAIVLAFGNAVAAKPKHKERLKVGLVLGGGGAKGAAHVGVLRTIERLHIPIDYIVGTSIGSIVGGLYSVGYRSDSLAKMFVSEEWGNLFSDRDMDYNRTFIRRKNGVTFVLGYPVGHKKAKGRHFQHGLLRGDSIMALLTRATGHTDSINFDCLPIPFRCVAVDMNKFREVTLSSGVLPVAMRASMSIPGVFKPVVIDSMKLIDGGALNNLPVDVARAMGADVVIAVDLTQHKRKTRDRKMHKRYGLGKILEWVRVRPDLKKYNINRLDADVYINPDLKGYSAKSFKPKKIKEMIEIGNKAGRQAESSLKKLEETIYSRRKAN